MRISLEELDNMDSSTRRAESDVRTRGFQPVLIATHHEWLVYADLGSVVRGHEVRTQ